MEQYTGFFVTLMLIFIIVVFSKYIVWWLKSVIVAYYIVVSYYFIIVKNRIDKEFEGISPVPDTYWDQNSGWVDTITNYLFLPLAALLVFIYVKWFTKTQSRKAKILILISLIPSALLFMFFLILFSFAYGYRPYRGTIQRKNVPYTAGTFFLCFEICLKADRAVYLFKFS